MAFEPEILCSESCHVDNAEHVSLSRLNGNAEILGIVHERSVWHRLCACGIGKAEEAREKTGHLIVVPIREREHNLFIILILVRSIWVADDQGSTKTIRILPGCVRVIPICAGLFNLFHYLHFPHEGCVEVKLTMKSYVKDAPAAIGHCVAPTGPSISLVPF